MSATLGPLMPHPFTFILVNHEWLTTYGRDEELVADKAEAPTVHDG